VIVLDTNVVSELMRPVPHPGVLRWFDAQVPGELWLTAAVAAELMFGVARLPETPRKQQLAQAVSIMLEEDFAGKVFAFDLAAASVYAVMVAGQQGIGRSIATADAQIAAICLCHGASLATRNTKHFAGLGLELINPWET
jgi:predicted nucleic acid-binding protein